MSRIQSIPRLFVHYRPLMLKVFAAYNVHTIPYNVSGTKTFEDVCIRGIRQNLTDVAQRMAEAPAEPESALGEEKIECGYCYEYNDRLVTPKLLPCGHAGCLPCLQKDLKANTVLRCTFCR